MALAISTRWLGPRPFGEDALLGAMRGFDVRACVIAAASRARRPAAVADAMRSAGAKVAAFEAGSGSTEEGSRGSLVSAGEHEGGLALASVLDAIAAARAIGAPRVILHLGELDGEPLRTADKDAVGMIMSGATPDEIAAVVTPAREDLARRLDPYLERACRVLHRITRGAADVRFAICTARAIGALPTPKTLRTILDDVGSPNLGYWHDAGAAWRQERLRVEAPGSWLGECGSLALGAFLSDATAYDTHLPPGAGEIDFTALREGLPSGAVCTLDVDPRFSESEVGLGFSLLRSLHLS